MRDYAVARPVFWTRGTGKQLRGDSDAIAVAWYLMTSPHSTMLGLYYLPIAYISHDTGIPLEGASKALQRVCETGFAQYDEASEYVWVVNMAREQIAERLKPTDNRVKSVAEELQKHAKCPFFDAFVERYADAFCLSEAKGLRRPSEAPSKPGTGTGSGTGSGVGESAPDSGVRKLPTPRLAAPPPAAELEFGEPEPEESTFRLLRDGYAARLHSKTSHHPCWTSGNIEHLHALETWVDAKQGEAARIIARLLDGFFASSKARRAGFPIAFLATNPAEYFTPTRDVRAGFLEPADASAFKNPTNLDAVFGPEPPGAKP